MKVSNTVIFLLYMVFFALLFLQFPLNNSLTGELDGLANLAMFKQLHNWLISLFTGESIGSLCYPSKHVWIAFGADFGSGILHVLFNFMGMNDLWAHWLFYSVIFASNSYGLYLLALQFNTGRCAAIIAGLMFSCAQFTFGNLENPNTLVFFLCFLSLTYYMKFVHTGERRFFVGAVVVGAVQIYIIPYVFVFHFVAWIILIIRYEPFRTAWKAVLIRYILTAISYAIIIFPFIYHFILQSVIGDYYNIVAERGFIHVLCFNLDDFFRVLPNHLYLEHKVLFDDPWLTKFKSYYLGVVFWGVVLYGVFKYSKKLKKEWFALIIVGVLFAIGPYLSIRSVRIMPGIAWPLYEYLNFDSIIRIPSRAFFIALIGLSMIVGVTLANIARGSVWRKVLSVVLFGLIMVENIPMPFEHYDQDGVLNPDREWVDLMRSSSEESVIVHLPSSIFNFRADKREYTYMYWQSFHKRNILNGLTGWIAPERLANNDLMTEWENDDNLLKLIQSNNLDFVLYHKDLADPEIQQGDINILNQHPSLQLKLESERTIVYEVLP